MKNKSIIDRFLKPTKENFPLFRLHWHEYPNFFKMVCLYLFGLGCVVFLCEYIVLLFNEMIVYVLLASLGEELIKSSVRIVALVSFVDYRLTSE